MQLRTPADSCQARLNSLVRASITCKSTSRASAPHAKAARGEDPIATTPGVTAALMEEARRRTK
eukprot:1861841-Alexandrium_andersonii.AAC.1